MTYRFQNIEVKEIFVFHSKADIHICKFSQKKIGAGKKISMEKIISVVQGIPLLGIEQNINV